MPVVPKRCSYWHRFFFFSIAIRSTACDSTMPSMIRKLDKHYYNELHNVCMHNLKTNCFNVPNESSTQWIFKYNYFQHSEQSMRLATIKHLTIFFLYNKSNISRCRQQIPFKNKENCLQQCIHIRSTHTTVLVLQRASRQSFSPLK